MWQDIVLARGAVDSNSQNALQLWKKDMVLARGWKTQVKGALNSEVSFWQPKESQPVNERLSPLGSLDNDGSVWDLIWGVLETQAGGRVSGGEVGSSHCGCMCVRNRYRETEKRSNGEREGESERDRKRNECGREGRAQGIFWSASEWRCWS